MVSSEALAPLVTASDLAPLGLLPRVSAAQVRLERVFSGGSFRARIVQALSWLVEPLGEAIKVGPIEVEPRASGLSRPGAVAQFVWPRYHHARLGLGFETALVHALIDRLLGFERRPGEQRLQVTPVEWGVLTYILARTLAAFSDGAGPDLLLERVGPAPLFGPTTIPEPMMTVRWPLRIGMITGTARLWLPRSLTPEIAPLAVDPFPLAEIPARFGALAGSWHARAGSVSMPRGLRRLRVGGVLLIDGSPLRGTPSSPDGPIELTARDRAGRSWFQAEIVPRSGGGRLRLRSPLYREIPPREPLVMSTARESNAGEGTAAPTDVPVTLAVELGRISIPLRQLADLKPGDVLELGRHAREPVELTSNGRLVARGELVQVDLELGVRVTHVFL